MHEYVTHWQVHYGEGEPVSVLIPHAWKQEVPVTFEGPVVYSTTIDVPREPAVLVFHGVSYEAIVAINGKEVLTHRGMWDAFEVPLDAWMNKKVEIQVTITKNGGSKFPVRDVASGFLPYVYHTFGGIHGRVEIVKRSEIEAPAPSEGSRVYAEGSQIYVDGEPFYMRGLLHWGWYPELGHTNPPEEVIRREVREAKALGFNLVKFCLWVPSHAYLDILREEGMEAWLELPLWDPTSDPHKLEEIGQEMERIVRQYRHHDNIIVWTVGCELSHATPPEYREYLVNLVHNLTGCPLVKDNSGGAEMYGGDLREFGSFYDYHPYCDTPFYPSVLDSLLPGPRQSMPLLLGEFNDIDVHRDLARLHEEMPYWASSMSELNDQGVRWQHDLPGFIRTSPLATGDEYERHERLMKSSAEKALFMRKCVHEWVRARDPISGYAITGWRDTPISTSGFFDDWDRPRYRPEDCLAWNGPDVLFLIPVRRPPWINGGNRPGFLDPFNYFVGQIFFRIGIHSESGQVSGLVWRILDSQRQVLARGAEPSMEAEPLRSVEVAQLSWVCQTPGAYRLEVEFGPAANAWNFFVEPEAEEFAGWSLEDPRNDFAGLKVGEGEHKIFVGTTEGLADHLSAGLNALVFLDGPGTAPAPFWRESAYEFAKNAPFAEQWERLLALSGDRVLELKGLQENLPSGYNISTLINRVDARTYAESPVLVRATGDGGAAYISTLRPQGGLGVQPLGLVRNPAGIALLRSLIENL